MKILYVGGINANQKGAIGSHTMGIIQAFKECEIISLDGMFFKDKIPEIKPEFYYIFNEKISNRVVKKILQYYRFIKFFYKILKHNSYDYYYFRFDPFISPFISNKKMITEYNDLFFTQIKFAANKGEWKIIGRLIRTSFPYRTFILWAEKYTFKRSYLTIVVTKKLKEYCQNIDKNIKIHLMLNASFKIKYIPNNIQKDEYLNIGHIGTITYWDGLTELLYAIKYCIKSFPDCKIRLFIVGSGSLKENLSKTVLDLNLTENVVILNEVPFHYVRQFYNQIDIVPLLKTIDDYDLSPIKYYEALIFGKTLIVSNIPHINELPSFAGKVVNFPLDIVEIGNILYSMFIEKSLIRSNQEMIHKYAIKNHTWQSRISELLKEL